MRKVAIFIHGWRTTADVWKTWGKDKIEMLFLNPDDHYDIVKLDMPWHYIGKKDFNYYASFLSGHIDDQARAKIIIPQCECCGQPMEDQAYERKAADEITLVCHDTGGVVARLYLQGDMGDPEAREKVKRIITMASPHHGMDSASEKITSTLLEQLQPGSEFMNTLNDPETSAIPENTDFYSIWAKGDLKATPIQTAVVDGAYNYFIDNITVSHLGILKHSVTLDIISTIVSGGERPVNGLQTYPPANGCGNGQHLWIPLWSDPYSLVKEKFKKYYLWKCENKLDGKKCTYQPVSLWRPGLKDCKVGHIEQKWRWHNWKKDNQKWQCLKCDTERTQNKKPKSRGNCQWPTPKYHRWRLKEQHWKCGNCHATEWEPWRFKPPVLGCPDGLINDRKHSWFKAEKRFRFRFKCAHCDEEVGYDGYDIYP